MSIRISFLATASLISIASLTARAEPEDPLSGYISKQAVKTAISAPSTVEGTSLPDTLTVDKERLHNDKQVALKREQIEMICTKIGKKLGSVSKQECMDAGFDLPRFYSNRNHPLLEKHFHASSEAHHAARILFLGGIHGDEYSSVSVSFKWLHTLNKHHSGRFDWHFMPLTNPDGLLQKRSTRVNANKVDLNRNFIPAQAAVDPIHHWQTYARKRARYYPGKKPLSEPETQAIHQLINDLKPDVIVSVHAPHGILDYDGSITPPKRLGPLHLKQLGTYPGSLGNYGWFVKQIPVMTIELKHAGIMPKQKDIDRMWTDLIRWVKLRTEGDGSLLARKSDN